MIATLCRVLQQLRHDPRTIALLVVVPAALMALLRFVFDSTAEFSHLAPALLAIFPFLTMFLVTSIATQRERTSGTLERLMTTPLPKLALLAGYTAAFGVMALVQVAAALTVSLLLGLSVSGSLAWLIVVTVVDAVLGVALGLLASAFAATEFQAIQMLPLVVLPQILLCGLFQPRGGMTIVLRWAADVLPLSYAVEALQQVSVRSSLDAAFVRDLVVLVAFVAGVLIAAAATLRRRTA